VSENLYRIGDVASYLGKSISTVRRWERQGRAPRARRVNGMRRYSESDLHALARIAQGPPSPGPSAPLDTSASPVTTVKAWKEGKAEPDPAVRPWEAVGGERPTRKLADLPTTCASCWRSLVRHGTTRLNGQRIMLASCEVHGSQAQVPW
jgi:hypothetical protein